jgi:peptidyl-prolyl cis-trans isomerase A (cyclophilin A)
MRSPLFIAIAFSVSCDKGRSERDLKTADQIDPAKNPWNADKLAAGDASANAAGKDAAAGASGSGAPATSNDEVRPPVAADLATYIKAVPGKGTKLFAKIETTKGVINCELFADKVPMTVANFVGLATGQKPWNDPSGAVVKDKPFFNGLTFHRVIKEFMIQGGDPQGVGIGGPGYQFADEIVLDLKMEPGSLAMANSGPATNGSQFFITEIAPDWLNGKHTIFGKCKELDIVKQIARVPQDDQNKPNSPITMKISIRKG